MNPKKFWYRFKNGDKFVFLQGGIDKIIEKSTVKIAFITPPVIIKGNSKPFFSWNIKETRPLKSDYQFSLLEEPNKKEFTAQEEEILSIINSNILSAKRKSKASKISSCVRNLCKGLMIESEGATKLLKLYKFHIENMRMKYDGEIFIRNDSEAY